LKALPRAPPNSDMEETMHAELDQGRSKGSASKLSSNILFPCAALPWDLGWGIGGKCGLHRLHHGCGEPGRTSHHFPPHAHTPPHPHELEEGCVPTNQTATTYFLLERPSLGWKNEFRCELLERVIITVLHPYLVWRFEFFRGYFPLPILCIYEDLVFVGLVRSLSLSGVVAGWSACMLPLPHRWVSIQHRSRWDKYALILSGLCSALH
jgi:hypothetical protein